MKRVLAVLAVFVLAVIFTHTAFAAEVTQPRLPESGFYDHVYEHFSSAYAVAQKYPTPCDALKTP